MHEPRFSHFAQNKEDEEGEFQSFFPAWRRIKREESPFSSVLRQVLCVVYNYFNLRLYFHHTTWLTQINALCSLRALTLFISVYPSRKQTFTHSEIECGLRNAHQLHWVGYRMLHSNSPSMTWTMTLSAGALPGSQAYLNTGLNILESFMYVLPVVKRHFLTFRNLPPPSPPGGLCWPRGRCLGPRSRRRGKTHIEASDREKNNKHKISWHITGNRLTKASSV